MFLANLRHAKVEHCIVLKKSALYTIWKETTYVFFNPSNSIYLNNQ